MILVLDCLINCNFPLYWIDVQNIDALVQIDDPALQISLRYAILPITSLDLSSAVQFELLLKIAC